MSGLRGLAGRVMGALFPWPARHERAEAISTARRQKEASRASAAEAAGVEEAIRQMAGRNHFAEALARQLAERHLKGGGAS